jgi:hypothetical protein
MSQIVKAYKDRTFSDPFTGDDQYLDPIRFGTMVKPVDTTRESDGIPFPIWIRNDGDEPLFGLQAQFTAGPAARGGQPGSLEASYPEISLDDYSRLPYCQAHRPSALASGPINLDKVVTASHSVKTATHAGDDDDIGTFMPGEYCVLWARCSIKRSKIPGGSWPPPYGMKNLRLLFSTLMFGMSFDVALQLVIDTDLSGETYYVMNGDDKVLWE